MKKRLAKLAIALSFDGDKLPTEFRIFTAGVNHTEKGDFLFDNQAATKVMSHYAARGVDVMLDLEHLSLEDTVESRNFDPDARGWCRLELRSGELWAVDVRWTPDGARRLSERTQRYVSPAFVTETEDGGPSRIVEVMNIAICANPATHQTPALIAANKSTPRPSARANHRLDYGTGGGTMDLENISAIAEALGLGPDASVEDVIAAMGAFIKKIQDGMAGDTPPADGGDPPMADPGVGDPAAMRAASIRMLRIFDRAATQALRANGTNGELTTLRKEIYRETDRKTPIEALSVITRWKASHLELADEKAKLEKDRKQLEASDRFSLCKRLVACMAATPAMVWKKGADELPDGKTPSRIYELMSIDELKEHVEAAEKAKGARSPMGDPTRAPTPPEHGGEGRHFVVTTARNVKAEVALTDSEVALVTKQATKNKQDVDAALTRFATTKANLIERSSHHKKAG